MLDQLDLVIAAVHSKFALPREQPTARALRALDNQRVTILAHPAGRLIGEREPYDVDMAAILRKARECGRFLDLKAHPDRLDLIDTHCRMAKELGVLMSINTDTHAVAEYAQYAIWRWPGASRLAFQGRRAGHAVLVRAAGPARRPQPRLGQSTWALPAVPVDRGQ